MANKSIRTNGFTTINEFEGDVYFFNSRFGYDIKITSVVFEATSGKYKFYPDGSDQSTFREAELNADKTELTFVDGEKWYRSGSDECKALLPINNIDINDVYPNVTPRTCGAEYKYQMKHVQTALSRLSGTKLINGDVNVYLKSAIRSMVIAFRANPTTYQFCSGFDASVASSIQASFSGGFYLREKFELSKDTFGMDWREFITHMYEDVVNAKSQSVDVSLDFADFVRDDFNNFFLNKQSFLDKAALTLSQVGVYRPNTINAEAEFNLLLRSMKKRFDLGVPFCEAIDTTYREVESLVDESTDRFTDSVANFGNSVRYYIEEFVLEVFNSDDDFCTAVNNVATDSWGFDMTTESAAVYGHVQTGIKLAAAAFANDDANVQKFASELFNNLEFSSFADQTVDIDFKAVIRTAFTNINMGTANFAFINGDDQKSLSDNFFARVGTMINSFNNIPDIAATCATQPADVKAIFVSFVTDTQVFPQGFCDANWSEAICSKFNSIVDKYNNMKLEFDLFESETLADIADKVSSKVDKVVSGLSAKVGLLQKGRQLAKEVVINFNEARTRLAPLEKVKAAFTQIGPKLVTFINDVAQLKADCESENDDAVAKGEPAVYDFNGEAWTMISTLLQEANDWNTNGAGRKKRSVKSRQRRSFNDLDYNDPEDRHILRQHVPFFSK